MSKFDVDGFSESKIARSNLERLYFKKISSKVRQFEEMPRLKILCGINGGLPFNCLMTDIYSGCKSIGKICYGNCSAAEYWIEKKHNFGRPVLNIYEEKLFIDSVLKLPKSQRWLRQGWVSDCSLSDQSWLVVSRVAKVLKKFDISMMIITKSYSFPSDHILNILAQCDTEIRVSISALDSSQELKKRVRLLAKYKTVGGKSIPYLMSSRYSDLQLISNQIALTKWIEENDMIAAEHPLRISSDNKIISLLAGDGFWHPKFINQYWFGRLYENHSNFMLPPPTHLLPEYHLRYRSASEAQGKIIIGLDGNLPTFSSLQTGKVEVNNNLFKHASYGIKEK